MHIHDCCFLYLRLFHICACAFLGVAALAFFLVVGACRPADWYLTKQNETSGNVWTMEKIGLDHGESPWPAIYMYIYMYIYLMVLMAS